MYVHSAENLVGIELLLMEHHLLAQYPLLEVAVLALQIKNIDQNGHL